MKSLSVFQRFISLFNVQVSSLKKVRNLSRKGKSRSDEILTDCFLKICALQVCISKARYLSLGSFRSVDVSFSFVTILFLLKYFPSDVIHFKCIFCLQAVDPESQVSDCRCLI